MKIYTRTGDRGTTGLFGDERVAKTHPRIEAYGTVDETASHIGLARSLIDGHPGHARLDELLARLQHDLFVVGADLATPPTSRAQVPRITSEHVRNLELAIDRFEEDLPTLRQFILPGGNPAAAALHVARSVSRRAERLAVAASASEDVSQDIIIYLNRLSDLLFVTARWTNLRAGSPEQMWTPETNL